MGGNESLLVSLWSYDMVHSEHCQKDLSKVNSEVMPNFALDEFQQRNRYDWNYRILRCTVLYFTHLFVSLLHIQHSWLHHHFTPLIILISHFQYTPSIFNKTKLTTTPLSSPWLVVDCCIFTSLSTAVATIKIKPEMRLHLVPQHWSMRWMMWKHFLISSFISAPKEFNAATKK